MIELIIALGIGAALGGVTLFLGFHFGFNRGFDAGYKEAARSMDEHREILAMLRKNFERTQTDWNSLKEAVTPPPTSGTSN